MSKKALIYTGSTGAGHTLAALSIEEALKQKGFETKIIDAFVEGGDIVNKTINRGYSQLVEYLPLLYKRLYDHFDEETRTTEYILRQGAKILKSKILNDIKTYKPDLIISTHPIVTNIIGRLKDNGEIRTPILSFITDYKIHEMYLRDSIDAYVVGSEYTKESMLERGVPADKIYPYGIPIRKEFRTIKKYPKNPDVEATILLMAGSLGSRQLKKAFIALLNSHAKLRLVAVCGHNKRMEKELNQILKTLNYEGKDVEILGFVDNISELMDEADAIITKPGGLTTTEAISKNIPIIIPYTYPGQEEENARYLIDNGMAMSTEHISDLTQLVDYLSKNAKVIEEMQNSMSEEAANFSIEDTVKLCEELASAK